MEKTSLSALAKQLSTSTTPKVFRQPPKSTSGGEGGTPSAASRDVQESRSPTSSGSTPARARGGKSAGNLRLEFLLNAARQFAIAKPKLSSFLMKRFSDVAAASKAGVDKRLRTALCGRCGALSVPGVNCRVRTRKTTGRQEKRAIRKATGQRNDVSATLSGEETVAASCVHISCGVCGSDTSLPGAMRTRPVSKKQQQRATNEVLRGSELSGSARRKERKRKERSSATSAALAEIEHPSRPKGFRTL